MLEQYEKAPEVTRQRLYIDAVESVMAGSTKVLVDVDGGNNLLYLPLDKMVSPGGLSGESGSTTPRPRIDSDRVRQTIGDADSRRRDLRGEEPANERQSANRSADFFGDLSVVFFVHR